VVRRHNNIQHRRIYIRPYGRAEAYICAAVYPYASPLAAVFAPIHVAGAAAYLTGVLGRFATERRLRTYGVYEAVELGALLYLSYLTWRPLS
jgi:hypothetical protein